MTATNGNLAERMGAGAFREDLYYRLNIVHITIPPLRQRRDDVPELLRHYLNHFAAAYAVRPPDFSDEVFAILKSYDWPGNVRELRNVVERLVVRAPRVIGVEDLPPDLRGWRAVPAAAAVRIARADAFYARLVHDREVFWSAVYDPFMRRDLTREDLREIVTRGLDDACGSYTALVRLFNLGARDYKRFLGFLHAHGCYLPVRRPRPAEVAGSQAHGRRASSPS